MPIKLWFVWALTINGNVGIGLPIDAPPFPTEQACLDQIAIWMKQPDRPANAYLSCRTARSGMSVEMILPWKEEPK